MNREIESKIAFIDAGEGKRIPLRAKLEAKWAVFFTQCGLNWHYEPKTFRLPSGEVYTPDFLVEKVGWFEIKPSAQILFEERIKIVEFCKSAPSLLSRDEEKHFFVTTGGRPKINRIILGYAPTKKVALVRRFWAASSLGELPLETFHRVIERAEKMAEVFQQGPINMRECLFKYRHGILGTSFQKLAKDFSGEDEFSVTVEEFCRGYGLKPAKHGRRRAE